MAVTHHADTRNAIATAVKTEIDAGTGSATLEFQTSGTVEVATCTFPSENCGSVSGAVLTFGTIADDTSATGGTVAQFVIKSATPTDCVYGSVGTTGEDINLSSLNVGSGDTVSVSSLTYTAPV